MLYQLDDSVSEQPSVKLAKLNTQKPLDSYEITKSKLAVLKDKLANDYRTGKIDLDSVGRFFSYNLVYKILPYWYGTPWTFEGHTNTPNKGEIACGYLISTTLKHFGMKVNRYKMAQQAALVGLKMIAKPEDIKKFSNDSFGDAAKKIEDSIGDGLYKVGFDYHVGYLYIDSLGMHFIHSNYMDPVAVIVENAHFSDAFNNTTAVYVTKMTNPFFLKKWLNNEEFSIP